MKHLRSLIQLGVHSLFCMSLCAQTQLPAKKFNLLVGIDSPHKLASENAGSLTIPVYGENYSLKLQSDWLTATSTKQGIHLKYSDNKLAGTRVAQLTIRTESGKEKNIQVIQPENESMQQAISNTLRIFPTRATANMAHPGGGIELTQDENTLTNYHSPWDKSISEEDPAILTYYFDTPVHLDMVTYIPVSGYGNGKFGLVDIYIQKKGETTFKLLGSYDFKMQNLHRNIYFGENGMDDLQAVQFVVKSGYSFIEGIQYYATCAEMEFKQILKPNDSYIKRLYGVTASNNGIATQNGEGIERTLDGNQGTLFHSIYTQTISEQNPAILTYQIPEGRNVQKVIYIPRQDSNKNGNFGQVKVEYRTEKSTSFTTLINQDFGQKNTPTEIELPQTEQPIREVRFTVTSGYNGFASCAEMEFYERIQIPDNSKVFTDNLMTTLREGVSQKDIDQLTDPLAKNLAQDLLNGVYDTRYRVAEYPCLKSPKALSDEWNTPGKLYDQLQGVTGINISPGKNVVLVEGADPNISLQLKVVAWYNGDNQGPVEYSYALINGVNTFEYTGAYDGLAYICYYSDENPQNYAPVKIHFPYGQVNGYLTPDKTNEEMHQMTANARNTCMDLVGEKVHSIWTAKGLHAYCKASDGYSIGYRQYMNLLDTLVNWEHRLLGLEKYGRIPTNKTMAYVNYTFYMFQGAYGVSFKYDQEPRVLDCRNLMYNDDDAIWGLSHEWGHQHQMQPYFCWSGLGESSNNMNSCYNVLHMGYQGTHGQRIQSNWTAAYNHLFLGQTTEDIFAYQYAGKGRGNYVKNENNFENVNWGEGDYVYESKKYGVGAVAESRNRMYDHIDEFDWCPAIQEVIRKQYDSGYRIPDITDTEHTVSTNELYVEENTAAFFMLYCYFSDKNNPNYVKDFQEDLYEALRQNDLPNGSSIEKQGTADKYELLASAHNGNKEKKYDIFKAKYPQSCWITQGYLKEGGLNWTQNSVPFIFNYIRKASRLCGYNLFDYFDKMGFLRTIALAIDDYGIKYYVLTEDMKKEFQDDMNKLGLKTMSDNMIHEITEAKIPTFNTPQIPN